MEYWNTSSWRGLFYRWLLPIPLPSYLEKKEIVKKVEKLFVICNQLEVQITSSQANADELMQAVLKEAFTQEDRVAI